MAHVAEADRVDGGDLDSGGDLGPGRCGCEASSSWYCWTSRLATLIILLSQKGQLQRPGGAVDQLHPQPFLQLQDNLADRGLRQPVRLRSLRKTALPGNVTEHDERFNLHVEMIAWDILISRGGIIIKNDK